MATLPWEWQAQLPGKPVLPVSGVVVTEKGETLTVQRAFVSVTGGANTTVVAAVTGCRIRVIGYVVSGGTTATSFVFKSGTTAISGTKALAVNADLAVFSDHGLCQTLNATDDLKLTAGAGNAVDVDVLYVTVTDSYYS